MPLNFRDTMGWGTITALTQFVFQMNAKFGHGTLWKIITGRSRRPRSKRGFTTVKSLPGGIGIIKRDITFSGDVLNTTSRIQNKCKEFNVEMIASSKLLYSLSLPRNVSIRELGFIQLRGKETQIELSTLSGM